MGSQKTAATCTHGCLHTLVSFAAFFAKPMTHQNDDQVDVTVDALDELLQSGGGVSEGMDLS